MLVSIKNKPSHYLKDLMFITWHCEFRMWRCLWLCRETDQNWYHVSDALQNVLHLGLQQLPMPFSLILPTAVAKIGCCVQWPSSKVKAILRAIKEEVLPFIVDLSFFYYFSLPRITPNDFWFRWADLKIIFLYDYRLQLWLL